MRHQRAIIRALARRRSSSLCLLWPPLVFCSGSQGLRLPELRAFSVIALLLPSWQLLAEAQQLSCAALHITDDHSALALAGISQVSQHWALSEQKIGTTVANNNVCSCLYIYGNTGLFTHPHQCRFPQATTARLLVQSANYPSPCGCHGAGSHSKSSHLARSQGPQTGRNFGSYYPAH